MEIHAIHNDRDYQAAAHRIAFLWDALPASPEEEELEILCDLAEAYEHRHRPAAGAPLPGTFEGRSETAVPPASLPDTDPDSFLLELGNRLLPRSA